MRSFNNNPSYLLDICRHTIVFQTIADLTNCLAALIADPEVQIMRIKNRYSREYDATQSAGYRSIVQSILQCVLCCFILQMLTMLCLLVRDVAINIKIINETTIALGAESHICELQLILKSFAEVKSLSGHQRYKTWRDLRGE